MPSLGVDPAPCLVRRAIARRKGWAALFLALVGSLTLGLAGCGPEAGTAIGDATSAGRDPAPPASPRSVTFTQIMLLYRRDGTVATVTRSKDEARALAYALIARIRGGESMEALLAEHTDDRGDDGRPFNRGSYTMGRTKPANKAIKAAAFGLAIGEMSMQPIDSGLAFHVIRRDA